MPDEIRTKNLIRHAGWLEVCEQHGISNRWANKYDAECRVVEHNRLRHNNKQVAYTAENPD